MPTIARKHYHYKENWLIGSLGIPGLYYLAPLLCSEKWRSITLIPKLTLPMLFLIGGRDEVIPKNHMEELYAAANKASTKGISQFEIGFNESMEILAQRDA